ncbi:uncharacterized protein LOC134221009 isoform X2 [Armigeres subalbatus]|uniref:uncharacterized protein LOC134221009 isoform X2 n=1 Tax=Armigeres subalbatus TaxID=124917 RepID=UPI002ED5BB6B
METCPYLGDCSYSFRFPKEPAYGKEITIKAVLRESVQRFSINLCLDPPNPCEIDAEPGWIAYHFGIDFTDEGGNCRVTQRSRNVCWDEPSVCDDEFLNGRTIHIIFRLDEEKIKVYHEDTQQAPNYEYSPTLPIHLIRTVELRGDIDQVDAIELKYTTFPN